MTRLEAPVSPPTVLTIAGSDSGGGAGIQADLKTIEACGGFGTSAITSVTAQNTRGVEGSHLLPIEDIAAQIDAVRSDLDVAAVKTGMLATADVVELVAEYAPDLPNLVVDPVMVAASGDRLLEPEAEATYRDLIADATLVTPNADEAAVLTDVPVEDEESAIQAGTAIVEDHGATAALVKGGHVPGDSVQDVLVSEDGVTTIRHDRVATDASHGSGCTLSAAIATELATGADLTAAVTAGVDLLGRAMRYNVDVGEGPGSVHHLVELRDDAALGETVGELSAVRSRLGDEAIETLGGPAGVTAAAATPYAEEPGDVVASDLAAAPASGSDAVESIRLEPDGPATEGLLAAREDAPSLRFCLACRYDDAVAIGLRSLDAPTVTSVETGAADAGITGAVRRAFASAGDRPVAVGPAETPDGRTTFLFGETASNLAERSRALAVATGG